MTSKQQHNNLNAHTNPRENFKKNFSEKYNTQKKFFSNKKYIPKIKKFLKKCYPKYAYIRDGRPLSILFTFENFAPQKTPFLRFFRFCTFLWAFSESTGLPLIFVHFRNIAVHFRKYYMLYIGITI